MKTLSLLQPWAGLIMLGIKRIETQSWKTQYRGPLLIHSSAKITTAGHELIKEVDHKYEQLSVDEMKILEVTGCILGMVDLVDCISSNDTDFVNSLSHAEQYFGDYSPNRWLWKLENPRLSAKPIPAKGALSLWEWDAKNLTI